MATEVEEVEEKEIDRNEKISQLHEIIAKNLTIGVSTLGDETEGDDLIMDDHLDMKSNASGYSNWRRGSVSYSQPNSPKGNPSLSPVSSVSSISELSTEYQDDGDSESCASLNSASTATSNESFNTIFHELIITKTNDNIQQNIQQTKSNRSRNEIKLNSKTSLDIPLNKVHQKKKKKKKKQNKLNRISKAKSHNNEYKRKTTRQKSSPSKSNLKSKPKTKSKSTSKLQSKSKSKSKIKFRPKLKQRRSSKDCLDISGIGRLSTKSIETWNVSEVVEWIKLIDNGKYKEYAEKFRIKKIDGKKLFKMNRSILQGIEVYHPAARKAILAALQKMKMKVSLDIYPCTLFYVLI